MSDPAGPDDLAAAHRAGFEEALALSPAALESARWAYMLTEGPFGVRVEAAVRGYLFAMRERKPFGKTALWAYPSLNQLRASMGLEPLATPDPEDHA